MASNKFFYSRNNLFVESSRTLCHPYCQIIEFLGVDFEPFVIAMQERKQSGYCNSLITILERMVLNHKVEENTGPSNKRRIQTFAREPLKRGHHTAFKYLWEPSRKIGYWLVEREMFFCKPEGKVFDFFQRDDFHYSLPSFLSTSPYSRTTL